MNIIEREKTIVAKSNKLIVYHNVCNHQRAIFEMNTDDSINKLKHQMANSLLSKRLGYNLSDRYKVYTEFINDDIISEEFKVEQLDLFNVEEQFFNYLVSKVKEDITHTINLNDETGEYQIDLSFNIK